MNGKAESRKTIADSRETIAKSKVRSRFALVALLSSICFGLSAFAVAAESGSSFLRIDPSARPAAMGGAYTAAENSVDTLAYNPGALATLNRWEASFTHAEWLVNTRYDYLAYGQTTKAGTFGLSAVRMGYGDLEGRDLSRRATGAFSAYDSAYTLAYANRLGTEISLGGAVKILERKIDSEHASSYAMDFGGLGRIPGTRIQLGASVLNIGPGTRFMDQTDPLPLTFAIGAAYKGRHHPIQVNVDLKHQPNDRLTTAIGGLEYSPVTLLALRAGYQIPIASTGEEQAWDVNNLRGGIGLQIAKFRMDYALAPFGDLGLTHRFTLSFRPDFLNNVLATETEN